MKTNLMTLTSFLFAESIALSGCSNSLVEHETTNVVSAGEENGSVIIGDIGWSDVTNLDATSAQWRNSRFVAHLDIPAKGTRCTGFLINENTIMTNHHCVSAAWMAQNLTANFQYEAGIPSYQQARFDCSTFIGANASLDYALLQCELNPGNTFGVADFSSSSASRTDPIYVIHQNCDYYTSPSCAPTKKYSPGYITSTSREIQHNADTLGGSSGSPLFSSNSHSVIGIHHAGSGGFGNGRGSANYAVPMDDILSHLQSSFPSVSLGLDGNGSGSGFEPPPPSDDLEPNDTSDAATVIALPYAQDNLRIGLSDTDMFRFEIAEPAVLSTSILFSTQEGDLDFSLHRSTPQTAALSRGNSITDDENITFEVIEPGTYFLVVIGYQGAQANYRLNVALEPLSGDSDPVDQSEPTDQTDTPDTDQNDGSGPDVPDAAYEPNDQFEQSAALPFPSSTDNLAISSTTDIDYFRFTLTEEQEIQVMIQFVHGEGDLDLDLLDANGSVIALSNGTTNEESIERSVPAGNYGIRVFGYSGAQGAYELAILAP